MKKEKNTKNVDSSNYKHSQITPDIKLNSSQINEIESDNYDTDNYNYLKMFETSKNNTQFNTKQAMPVDYNIHDDSYYSNKNSFKFSNYSTINTIKDNNIKSQKEFKSWGYTENKNLPYNSIQTSQYKSGTIILIQRYKRDR